MMAASDATLVLNGTVLADEIVTADGISLSSLLASIANLSSTVSAQAVQYAALNASIAQKLAEVSAMEAAISATVTPPPPPSEG